MAKFEKGWKGGPGRPKGSTDKKWSTVEYWFDLVQANVEDLDPYQRVMIGMKGFEILVAKMRNPPTSPEESVENVDEMIKSLEDGKLD